MGRKRLEKPGQKFGKWTLIKPSNDSRKWVCECECGTIKEVRADSLKAGATLSCGCDTKRLQREAKIRQGSKYDLTGMKFGEWEALSYAGDSQWLCRCKCGKEQKIQTGSLRFGCTKMCKACAEEYIRQHPPMETHGDSHSKLYSVFYAMHDRCEKPTVPHFDRYGGRGITVCEEWSGEDGYVNFSKWSKANGYKEGLQIDRRDNDKGYSPENCRWVSRIENMNNTSANRRIEIDGESKTVAEWARHFNIPIHRFYGRYVIGGWSLEDTLNIPVNGARKHGNNNQSIKPR